MALSSFFVAGFALGSLSLVGLPVLAQKGQETRELMADLLRAH